MMDPVQKAVINHTFGVTMVPKKKQVISCNVCQLRFNSDSQAEAHYRGSRHAKKLKSQENKAKAKMAVTAQTNGRSSNLTGPAPPISANSSTNQNTELLSSLTNPSSPLKPFLLPSSSPLSSTSPASSRAGSSKHKTMLEARSGAGPIKAYPRPGGKLKNGSSSTLKGSGLQNKTFHCQICDVHVNSEIQLKQ
ncbi:hypothetical protein PAMP_003302 [Pampus punctatissimus]